MAKDPFVVVYFSVAPLFFAEEFTNYANQVRPVAASNFPR